MFIFPGRFRVTLDMTLKCGYWEGRTGHWEAMYHLSQFVSKKPRLCSATRYGQGDHMYPSVVEGVLHIDCDRPIDLSTRTVTQKRSIYNYGGKLNRSFEKHLNLTRQQIASF
jgi:hypothetical protein